MRTRGIRISAAYKRGEILDPGQEEHDAAQTGEEPRKIQAFFKGHHEQDNTEINFKRNTHFFPRIYEHF